MMTFCARKFNAIYAGAALAAIARTNGASALGTRNIADFANLNINLINPWDAA